MPPKTQKQGKPAKAKVDSTFGMKNKKGGKGQAAVALAAQQESQRGRSDEARRKERERDALKAKKEAEARFKAEKAALFQPIHVDQKVPFGTDPKSVVCINFKNGNCDRGNRCRFSHDLNAGRKVEKKDLYTDTRDGPDGEGDEKKKDETMENWTEEKLREVVAAKMGTEDPEMDLDKGKQTQDRYDIVCKFFIDAIESSKYGWFWECPNGGTKCKYRHALPPGFVLKSQRKKDEEDEKAREISMEEFLEVERHKLGSKDTLTPVTKETFEKWKLTRTSKKDAEAELNRKTKEATAQAGKTVGMSGRDLFTFNPLLLEDEDEEAGDGQAGDDDWDMEIWRKRAIEEQEEAEKKRLEAEDKRLDDLAKGISTTNLNGSS